MGELLKIERRQHHYKRSRNGAWLSDIPSSQCLEVDSDELWRYGLGDGITVTWPDGHKESAFKGNHGVGDYPPQCVPHDGRLVQLLKVKRQPEATTN